MRLVLGSPVRCVDSLFGELADVVIDPISRRVTHLVVQPEHRHDAARLVSVDRARSTADGIALDFSAEELERLEPLRETAFLRLGEFPVADPDWDVGIPEMLALPLYPGAES